MEATSKIYPTATFEIAKMFGIDLTMSEQQASAVTGSAFPGNLPIVEGQLVGPADKVEQKTPVPDTKASPSKTENSSIPAGLSVPKPNRQGTSNTDKAPDQAAELSVPLPSRPESVIAGNVHDKVFGAKPKPLWQKVAKTTLPYAIVFGIGLVLYYFYFSGFSFLDLFKNTASTTKVNNTKQTAAVATLQKDEQAKYFAYMSQFYFDANSDIVDPNNDISGNGLTNFQKYLLNLNPKVYDTAGNGVPDGQAIISGNDPVTGRSLTDEQKKNVDAYFDLESISNRLALGSIHRQTVSIPSAPSVLGSEVIPSSGQNAVSGQASFATPSYTAPQTGTPSVAPRNNTSSQRIVPPSNTGTSFGSALPNSGTNSLGINTGIPGTLQIPSLNVTVPVVWTGDAKSIDSDLQKGVVHYPGTALPGSMGTAYISGHSSASILNRSPYRKIFDKLNNLPNGGAFTITVTLNSGKKAILHYTVDHRATFSPTDPAQFANTSDSVVALSTCWPIGTVKDRLVLFGKLTQVEQ